jgi:DNA-binding response OmpR family regulator
LNLLETGSVELIVLDLGLPDLDGLEVLRAAREGRRTPTIVLTARSAVEDRIRGLSLGADDYVTKPFSPTEVTLRVAAVLARSTGAVDDQDGGVQSFGEGRLLLEEALRRAVLDGVDLDLTPTEWGVLTTLASVPGRPFSRYELVNRVRGYEFTGYERSMDSHVKNLRHKLGPKAADVVETVVGVGYRLGLRRDT